jgi:hypothetical protein
MLDEWTTVKSIFDCPVVPVIQYPRCDGRIVTDLLLAFHKKSGKATYGIRTNKMHTFLHLF